jgi:hypothetical protein
MLFGVQQNMWQMARQTPWLLVSLLLCLGGSACSRQSGPVTSGHVISGRVVDPQQLQPPATRLSIRVDGNVPFIPGGPDLRWNGPGMHVHVNTDGSFVTPRLAAGTYVLQVLRSPDSRTRRDRFQPDRFVAFKTVTVGFHDISDVTMTIRPDFAVPGRFRMETDNPAARWPDYIGISAYLALEGQPPLADMAADGTQGGRFWLHNAFGPRVIRTNYRLTNVEWSPTRVLLDGSDITNVPTDFSNGTKGELEVVFTQHPSRFVLSVVDRDGQAIRDAWIVMVAADRSVWEPWATTTLIKPLDRIAPHELTKLPGRYLVRAFPRDAFQSPRDALQPNTFPSLGGALQPIDRLMAGAAPIDLGDRETKTLRLVVQ